MGVKIAGYLPAPKDAKADYALMGKASDGTQVVVAECHHEDLTQKPEQIDLASGLFGMQVKVAEPVKQQQKPQVKQMPVKKPAKNTAKVVKFPHTKSLYVNEKLIKNVDAVHEYADCYYFMYTGKNVYTISKGEINTIAGNSISVFISTK